MKRSSLCGLAALLAGLALAAGMQQNCKRFIKNYVLEHCSGFRDKRSLASGEMDPLADFGSATKQSRIRKRQAMTLSEIIMTSRMPGHHYPYPHVPSFIGAVYVPVVPPTDIDDYIMMPKHGALPQEKNSDLGFDMDLNQLDELFEELSDRLPRSPNQSINDIHDEFVKSAFACCMDNAMCKAMGNRIFC